MASTVVEGLDIDHILLDSIDEGLTDLFGPNLKQAFYGYFEEKFGFTRESIALRLDKFLVALSETFGAVGFVVLGRTIAKRLYSSLGLPFKEQASYTLLDYVKEAKMLLRLSELDCQPSPSPVESPEPYSL
jgi:hypothetical protein